VKKKTQNISVTVASHLSSETQLSNATHLITIMDKERSNTKQHKYYTNANTS